MRTRVPFLATLLTLAAGCSMIAGVQDLAYVDPAPTNETSPTDPAHPGASGEGGASDAAAAPSIDGEEPPESDAGVDPIVEAGVDAAVDPPPVVGAPPACTGAQFNANDRRGPAAIRVVTLAPAVPGLAQQYSPRCMSIRAGQSVTFVADFGNDPLAARSQNPASPITLVAAGNTATFTFAKKGRYLYGSTATLALGGEIDVRP